MGHPPAWRAAGGFFSQLTAVAPIIGGIIDRVSSKIATIIGKTLQFLFINMHLFNISWISFSIGMQGNLNFYGCHPHGLNLR